MFVTSKIRHFIANLPDDEMFTTSQLLAFGKRSAIDQALFRLVNLGVIHRIARGLFIKDGVHAERITPEQAAQRKAARFGNKIVPHKKNLDHRMYITERLNSSTIFETNGSNSSFLFNGKTRIYFRRVNARKRKLLETRLGDMVRSLWELGKSSCTASPFNHVNSYMSSSDRGEKLPTLAALMPTWLHNKYYWRSHWIAPAAQPT